MPEHKKDNKIRKLSRENYKQKLTNARRKKDLLLKDLDSKYKNDLINANVEDRKILKQEYLKRKSIIKNKYILMYNSLINQKLYRKSLMEMEIDKEGTKRKTHKSYLSLNPEDRKRKFIQRVKSIRKKYSTPLSKKYLFNKNRKNELEIDYIKVPFKSPRVKMFNSIFLLVLGAIISVVALDIFVKPFGIYNSGLRGITQSIFYAMKHYIPGLSTSMSYVLFFTANIPLVAFGYIKLGKKVTIFTILFIAIQYLFSFIVDISGIEDLITPFGKKSDDIYDLIKGNNPDMLYSVILPFIGAAIGGALYGISVGLIYKGGGTTGGSKFIVTYISSKKNKSIGYVAKFVAVFVVVFGIMLNHVIIDGENIIKSYTSATLFASVVFIIVSNKILDSVFAKSSYVELTTITTKRSEIERFLDIYLMPEYKFILEPVNIGRQKKKAYKLEIIIPSVDARNIESIFRQIDKNAKVITKDVKRVQGNNYSTWYE